MRRLAVLIAFAALPALAVVPTVSVTGKVLAPNGQPYGSAGSIACTLQPVAGSVLDSTTGASQRIGTGPYMLRIAIDGTVTGELTPNDLISPSGTSYACAYTIQTAPATKWSETWVLDGARGAIDIGAIPRPKVAPIPPAGVVVPPAFSVDLAELMIFGSRSVVTTGNGYSTLTVAVPAPSLRATSLDLTGDTLPDPTWYIDRDGDGWYSPGRDLLLGADDMESDHAECNVGSNSAGSYPWQLGNKWITAAWPGGSQPPIQADPTNYALGAGQRPSLCYCWQTNPAVGDSCGVGAAISNALATPLKCTYNAAKMTLFQSTVCNYGGTYAREYHRLFVGGLATGAAHDLSRLRNGIGFYYAPRDDVDGDGTAGDGDGDANWWAVTAADSTADGTAGGLTCLQLADGNGDGYLDCNGDGTIDSDVQDQWYGANGYTAVNTGVRAYTSGGTTLWTCFDLTIAHERNVFRFWVNGRLVASLADHIPGPTQPLCFWGAIDDVTTSGSSACYAIDRVRYLGRP